MFSRHAFAADIRAADDADAIVCFDAAPPLICYRLRHTSRHYDYYCHYDAYAMRRRCRYALIIEPCFFCFQMPTRRHVFAFMLYDMMFAALIRHCCRRCRALIAMFTDAMLPFCCHMPPALFTLRRRRRCHADAAIDNAAAARCHADDAAVIQAASVSLQMLRRLLFAAITPCHAVVLSLIRCAIFSPARHAATPRRCRRYALIDTGAMMPDIAATPALPPRR